MIMLNGMASWLELLCPNSFSVDLANAHFQAALALAVMLMIILPWVRQWLFELALKRPCASWYVHRCHSLATFKKAI